MTATHAGVLFQDLSTGRVLLLRRAAHENNAGEWEFPAGGIEAGESSDRAAAREFAEETGLVEPFLSGNPQEYGTFVLWNALGPEFQPTLSDEHDAFQWVDPKNPPSPLRAPVAAQLANCAGEAMDYAESARQYDRNGYVTIARNPITRAGVFPYSGRVLPGGEPDRIYQVYRPLDELMKPEALNSLKLLPIINDHEMLGDGYARAPEERGVHGSTGEEISVEGIDVFAPIRIFSRALKSLIDAGKKGLSLGYRCRFEKSAGEFNGIRYDYIQRDIRGNHLALVGEGRCGTAVLDHHWAFDHVDLALDSKGDDMADEKKVTEAKDEAAEAGADKKTEMSVAEITAAISKLLPLLDVVEQLKAAGSKDVTTALDADEDKDEKKDKAEDEDESEKKDKAEDEDEKKEKKEEAMDAAEIKGRLTALETGAPKNVFAAAARRDALVKELTPLVGTFDHSAMDEADVTKYGLEKLELKADAGQEAAVLKGFIAGHKTAAAANVGFAMDSALPKAKAPTGKLAARLAKSNA